jgi:hypothetical protein
MKTQIMAGNRRSRPFLMITWTLLVMGSLCSEACVTASVMEFAKKKAAPSNVTAFAISKVHSASVLKNGDLSFLAELGSPNHPKSGPYTMTIPIHSHMEDDSAIESFGFRREYSPSFSGLATYLFPIGKAQKFSGDMVQKKEPSNSSILIEELNLHPDEAERLPELLVGLNRDPSREQKVYVVNLLSDADEKTRQEETDRATEVSSTIEMGILLVNWLPPTSDGIPRPIAITGAYEDESTNLYYLLVPPAIALDALLIALAVVAQGASYGCLNMH